VPVLSRCREFKILNSFVLFLRAVISAAASHGMIVSDFTKDICDKSKLEKRSGEINHLFE